MKPALVLVPGLLCDHALWQPQVDALSADFEILIPDMTQQEAMPEMAEAVLRAAPSARFALAGLSMGGYVAMEIMRQSPHRVTRLALLDTRARPDTAGETARRLELTRLAQTAKSFTPVTRRMLPLLVHASRVKDAPLVRTIREMADRTGVEGYVRQQKAIMSRADGRFDLRKVRAPTLVLCGRQDAITSLEMHEEMASIIPGAKLVVIEDCGHLSTLERPDEVNAALRDWLAV
ncbi:MAG: alpha/beta fold hydrolase [Burkholderiales bacterium]